MIEVGKQQYHHLVRNPKGGDVAKANAARAASLTDKTTIRPEPDTREEIRRRKAEE